MSLTLSVATLASELPRRSLAVTTRSRSRTVETASRSASDTATAAEPTAKRARTEASTSAVVTDESDIVSRIAAAYAADPIFADDNKTKHWNFLEDLWWDQEEIVVPDNQEVKSLIVH